MKKMNRSILSAVVIGTAFVWGAGCAGAADKDRDRKASEDIRWDAPKPAQSAQSAAAPHASSADAASGGLGAEDDMLSMWEEMDRLQRAMMGSFGGWGSTGWVHPSGGSFRSMGGSEMHADVEETAKERIITCELPGVPKKNIRIDVDGNTLIVRAVRDAGTDRSGEENGRKYQYRERSYGTTERRFRIGSGVDPKKIKADLKDGVLTLRVPKGEDRSVQVPIEG